MTERVCEGWGGVEYDAILVPVEGGEYKQYPLLVIFGLTQDMLRSTRGFGLSPLHYITQRGPQQDGETPLDWRLDPRIIQIRIDQTLANRTQFWNRRNEILDLLRPSRSFDGTIRPLIYRKYLPAGKERYGVDMVSDGNGKVTSRDGQFVTLGNLRPNDYINIAGTWYKITSVPNDYTITLDRTKPVPGVGQNIAWHYRRRRAYRDLYCFLLHGPEFDEGPGSSYHPTGFSETLRFIAHDPMWYGADQQELWTLPDNIVDLVFDYDGTNCPNRGAWFGVYNPSIPCQTGRWLFTIGSISEGISIKYWGTHDALPTIEITGPADNATLQNTNTGRFISVQKAIAAGETVTVNLLELTVTNNFGDNIYPFTEGDLALFGLSPDPQAPNRDNNLSANLPGADSNTRVTINWRCRFVGI